MGTYSAPNSSQESPSFRILIIGAGLAGLATAISLQQAGHRTTILERSKELQELGAGIQISPNATRLFKDWGVLEAVKCHGFLPPRTILRSYRGGSPLATQEMGYTDSAEGSDPYILLHRADLQRILHHRAESLGAQIILDTKIESIGLDGVNPYIRLSDGRLFDGDLLLGADGQRSFCREKLMGRKDPPSKPNNTVYRFTVPVSEIYLQEGLLELVEPPNINLWMGPNAHAVSYVVKKDQLLNVVLMLPQEPGDEVQYRAHPVQVSELKALLEHWDPRFRVLLDMAQSCTKWALLETDTLETWTHGHRNFALIGDSAHAMLPSLAQGASQCFEDAAVLGTVLANIRTPTQLESALHLYESLRMPRAAEIRSRSKQAMDEMSLPDGLEQQTRDKRLLESSSDGSPPILLMDPSFREWLWGYSAKDEAIVALQRNAFGTVKTRGDL